MILVGWICFGLGATSVILGLSIGVKDAFVRQKEAKAQALKTEGLFEFLTKLLDAPPAKFFTIVGLVLIILGLTVNKVIVF